MARSGRSQAHVVPQRAWEALQQAGSSVAFHFADDTVYELRLYLRTPGIFALYKADVPSPGLPMLDGFLKFVAFRRAMESVVQTQPDLTNDLLWLWNLSLREDRWWIDFPIPIREETLNGGIRVYDCSVGLPVNASGQILYPAGGFFACGGNLVSYPSEEHGPADSLPLRRRSVEPFYRPFSLTSELRTQSGGTRALDHRVYFSLSREYVFYFRGDPQAVEAWLNFATQHRIGIGKKTTLGYGQIAGFRIQATHLPSTLGQPIGLPGISYIALLKNIPYGELQRRTFPEPSSTGRGRQQSDPLSPNERRQNQRLFGARSFALASPVVTFDCYRPPYWRREGRTQVLRYGSLLIQR